MDKRPSALKLVKAIAKALYDKKGGNVLALDVREVNSMTDYFVIADGTSPPHLRALKKAVLEVLDKEGIELAAVEGEQNLDWVVVDCWQVVVHLFSAQLRERYGLERVWQEGKMVDLNLASRV
ncbi:MAG: ribosome silencing factor [Parachlamydiales bacterium]